MSRMNFAPRLPTIIVAPLYLRVIFGYRPADDDIEALIDAAVGEQQG